MMPATSIGEPAARDLELRLAHQLLSQESGIGRDILYELLARPKRYSELKPVLAEGKSENSLTVALKTLRRNGLVDQRTDARSSPPVHRYELTPLGIEVVLTMESLRPIEAHLAMLRNALGVPDAARTDEFALSGVLVADVGDVSGSVAVKQRSGRERGVWHVAPDPDGGWRVEREGASRATRVLDTKKEAVAFARRLANRETGRQVVVHKSDGTIQRHFASA